MENLDTFTTSDGIQHIMGWAICECYVWRISWRNAESVGKCGRCRKSAQPCVLGTTKEKAYEIFRDVHGRDPQEFDT